MPAMLISTFPCHRSREPRKVEFVMRCNVAPPPSHTNHPPLFGMRLLFMHHALVLDPPLDNRRLSRSPTNPRRWSLTCVLVCANITRVTTCTVGSCLLRMLLMCCSYNESTSLTTQCICLLYLRYNCMIICTLKRHFHVYSICLKKYTK